MNSQLINHEPELERSFDSIFGYESNACFYANSSSVGSGKTEATILHMLETENITQNFIYVAPTIKLVEEIAVRLKGAISKTKKSLRGIHLIHSQTVQDNQSASSSALEVISNLDESMGATIILTTQTFLKVLPIIKSKKSWKVVLDEAFSPLSFPVYELGTINRKKSKAYFDSIFSVDENDVVTPSEGNTALVTSIANGDWETVGSMYKGMMELAVNVNNRSIRVELVEKHENKYLFSAWVTPDYFRGFSEVIFLAALFEETVLFKLWTTLYDVAFLEHPSLSKLVKRDVHEEQGVNVSIGHLLHPEDKASRYNLTRNWQTGIPKESQYGKRVIDKCIETVNLIFQEKPYLLQVNNWAGYHRQHQSKLPKNTSLIPTVAHGLDGYKDKSAIAALAVTNPEPFQMHWLINKTGMSEEDVCKAFRIHTIYQAVGRTAIRAIGNSLPVTFIVVGKEDAEFLNKLFKGSQWLGQVGSMPRYSHKQGALLKDIPVYRELSKEKKRLFMRMKREVASEDELTKLNEINHLIKQLQAPSH